MQIIPFRTEGIVEKGLGEGRKLGFPTLNVKLEEKLYVDYGVYTCIVEIQGTKYKGLMHYGPRLVVGEQIPKLEIHVFDFDREVYGERVKMETIDFIRETMNFDSFEELKDQMNIDRDRALQLLGDVEI